MKHIIVAVTLTIIAMTCQMSGAWAACANPSGTAGEIFYNQTAKRFQYCNDTAWVAMNQPGSGSGGCANPTLAEGRLFYNTTSRVMQGCAGNLFRAMGPVGGGAGSGMNGWKSVAAGSNHTCGIKTDNTAWCWGTSNTWGQLGNGTTGSTPVYDPVPVSGGQTWKMITTSTNGHSCAIRSDDRLFCWGNGGGGRLGTGNSTQQSSPTEVSGGGTWLSVDTGTDHTCAIKTDNTGWCWGSDTTGQLGNGAGGSNNSPSAISGGGTWLQVSAGFLHSCGVKSDNKAYCWGLGSNYQLGDGSNTTQQSPVLVAAGADNWKTTFAGENSSCGIKADNTGWCWGSNAYGQLGNGATGGFQSSPVAISGGGTWKVMTTGYRFVCGVKTDNTGWCWGDNSSYQQGNGTSTNSNIPTTINGSHAWSSIDTAPLNGTHVCGVTTSNVMLCWGSKTKLPSDPLPYTLFPKTTTASGVWTVVSASGSENSCGLRDNGTIYCWGFNPSGQLGTGDMVGRTSPTAHAAGGVWKNVTIGSSHACGIKSDDTLWCWGDNGSGQLGDNTGMYSLTPVAVAGGGTWKAVSTYSGTTCGIKSDDTLWCWGDNFMGQVGDNTSGNQRLQPVQVNGGGAWKSVSSRGFYNTCGIKTNGTAWCWGFNMAGQVGDGTTTSPRTVPTAVSGGGTWKQISTGFHTCGIMSDDTARCWGSNATGQVGDGTTTTPRSSPVTLSGGGTWKAISTGNSSTCGIKSDDTLWCWGTNTGAQLGDNTLINKSVPTAVVGNTNWLKIEVGGTHVCGIRYNQILCWGNNANGATGLGPSSSQYADTPQIGNCSAPVGKPGKIIYNNASNRLQYCDGGNWISFGGISAAASIPADPCSGAPSIGTTCSDGTIYAGLSTDGNVKMYTTPADSSSGIVWNNGNSTGYVDVAVANWHTGAANTALLVSSDSDSGVGGTQPHQAAQLCDNLVAHGHSDWYLPGLGELNVLNVNQVAIGNFAAASYWTSTKTSASNAWLYAFNIGSNYNDPKYTSARVRCVRK